MFAIQVANEMVSAAKANLEKTNSAMQEWQRAGKQTEQLNGEMQ